MSVVPQSRSLLTPRASRIEVVAGTLNSASPKQEAIILKYLPIHCELHGWLLLDADVVRPRENHVIECEGHCITRDTRATALLAITDYLPKMRGLVDAEFAALRAKTGSSQ
jgi:hypothetical protein